MLYMHATDQTNNLPITNTELFPTFTSHIHLTGYDVCSAWLILLIFVFYLYGVKSTTQIIIIIHINEKQVTQFHHEQCICWVITARRDLIIKTNKHFFLLLWLSVWTVIHFSSPSTQQCEWWICLFQPHQHHGVESLSSFSACYFSQAC